MPRESFRFGFYLDRYDLGPAFQSRGPRFHRWLPDGEQDAIQLRTSEPSALLRVWFERRGRMDGGFIRYSHDDRAIDPSVIPRQGVLDAGPLLGQLDVELRPDEIAGLHEASETGRRLAKRLVTLIQEPIGRFVAVLRSHYGQYWLAKPRAWDSRRESLQIAISALGLRWRQPSGDLEKVVVGESVVEITASVAGKDFFSQFLTQDDWNELAGLANTGQPTAAAVLLGLTHEALDRGSIRIALIDASTACELCVNECLRSDSKVVSAALQAFWNQPLKSQFVALAMSRCPALASVHLEPALQALELRNKVVHEGWNPTDDAAIERQVRSLLTILAEMLRPLPFKFASADSSNELRDLWS